MNWIRRASFVATILAPVVLSAFICTISAQAPQQKQQTPPAKSPLPAAAMDPERARQLYVSNDPKDHTPGTDYKAEMDAKAKSDLRYPELCEGIIDYQKITYRSSVGDLDIPAPWGSSVGHAFSRRVDAQTLQRVDSPEQIDSWNRTWVFFEWNLRPYEDRSKPALPVRIK